MTTTTHELDVDLTDPARYKRGFPHELFTDLRRRGPVLRHRRVTLEADGSEVEFWAVIGHPEIQRANREWETFSSLDGPTIAPFLPEASGMTIVSTDPPDHSRVRRLISAGFTPRMVRTLDERIRARTDQILDDAAVKGDIDLVADVADRLPMNVIADIVGIDEDDRPHVFGLVEKILRSFDPAQGIPKEDRDAAQVELFAFASTMTARKRSDPADDVWSLLARGPLDAFELDVFFPILTTAGSETVRNTLSQGLIALVEHPAQLDDLRANPELIDTATEEVLRWASPAISFARTVRRDTVLGGAELRPGDRVAMFYPSGNRDEDVFAHPFTFDVRRTPNPHLAFGGGGPHFCLGANLARTEIKVMLSRLLQRFRTIEVTGDAEWISAGPSYNIGVAIQSLPVRLTE